MKECAKCHEIKNLSEFYQYKSGVNKGYYSSYCKPCCTIHHREYMKKYRPRLRAEVLQKLGGQCECCQEQAPEFLAIDHRYGDGKFERLPAVEMCRKVLKDNSDRYRLLCHNCNLARGFYGYCPHKS